MAYTPKTWVTGETIEAADLNHIEQGIAAADQSAAEAQETADEAKAIVADEFLTAKPYTTGEYCIYSGVLYRFKEDKTAGTWDSTKVVTVALADDVSAAKTKIDGLIVSNIVNSSWSQGYIKADGTIGSDTQSCYTDYILLQDGTYSVVAATGYKAKVAIYNASKVFQSIAFSLSEGTNTFSGTSGYYAMVQVTKISGNIAPSSIDDNIIEIKSAPYPVISNNVKVKYENIVDVDVSKSETDFIKINPMNLNDLSKMVVGIIENHSQHADLDSTVTGWRSTDYIPVVGGETYVLSVAGGVYYGNTFRGVAYYNENKVFVGRIIPTNGVKLTQTVDTITIPTGAHYIRTSYPKAQVKTPKLWYETQIFKGSTWINMYIPYDGEYRLQEIGLMPDYSESYNCLFGKKAIWNGDSICAADNDAQGGWAMRIAAANGMYAKNYGISGGTIAENTGASHSVCATLDTMISDFPDADYIIIEGGTNDADLIGDSGIGTFDADDFTDAYIQALNKDTFSGALESIFYRLVTQMKTKHIGYLIPQKMGNTEVLVARRRTYFDRAISIAQKWGIPVLDLWNNLYFNWRLAAHWNQEMSTTENENAGNLYVDGQHLTTTGYAIQSPIIAEWMKKI